MEVEWRGPCARTCIEDAHAMSVLSRAGESMTQVNATMRHESQSAIATAGQRRAERPEPELGASDGGHDTQGD